MLSVTLNIVTCRSIGYTNNDSVGPVLFKKAQDVQPVSPRSSQKGFDECIAQPYPGRNQEILCPALD
jgi:hypothetical protein